MKLHRPFFLGLSCALFLFHYGSLPLAMAQPRPIEIPELNRDFLIDDIRNIRTAGQSADGTETTIYFEYSYSGKAGSSAMILPIVDRRDDPTVSARFGAEPVIVPQGRGPVTVPVKYFVDEPGVPPTTTTDRIQVLLLNQNGTSILGGKTILRTIEWGSEDIEPVKATVEVPQSVEDKARETAELAAEAETRAKEEAREAAAAEQKAREEARQREEARLKAEQEAAEAAEAQRLAEEKARIQAEQKAREEAEAESRRLEEEKRLAEERAREAELARKEAEAKALEEAKLREEAEARAEVAEQVKEEQQAISEKPPEEPSKETAAEPARSRITNLDVVNRHPDRHKMTIAVEYEINDRFRGRPWIGLEVRNSSDPQLKDYFEAEVVETSRRDFSILNVTYNPPPGRGPGTVMTDQIVVYLMNRDRSERIPIHEATLMLMWKAPGQVSAVAASARTTQGNIELTGFRQNTLQKGYASVKYQLSNGSGQILIRIFDSNRPESRQWFQSHPVPIQPGRGLEVVPVELQEATASSRQILQIDTIEASLIAESGELLDRVVENTVLSWSGVQ